MKPTDDNTLLEKFHIMSGLSPDNQFCKSLDPTIETMTMPSGESLDYCVGVDHPLIIAETTEYQAIIAREDSAIFEAIILTLHKTKAAASYLDSLCSRRNAFAWDKYDSLDWAVDWNVSNATTCAFE
jgi:hypothetical protein